MARRSAIDDGRITTFGLLVESHAKLEQQLGRALERECGIPHSWFEVMLRIARSENGSISMGSLAQQVALTTGGITRLVDRMIAAGLIQRVPSPTDRRVYFAELTQDGQQTVERAAALHAENLRVVFAGFSERDLRKLDDLLDRLRGVDLHLA